MKRWLLFSMALLVALVIVGTAVFYRSSRTQAPPTSALALSTVTPAPPPVGLLSERRVIPFPGQETVVIPHPAFPLLGAHAELTCAACHVNNAFDATGSACSDCHDPPPDHFPGTCSSCHLDTTSFLNVVFDHSVIGATDCAACHAPPPDHFPGACRDCHQDTNTFRNANFTHTFPLDHGDANGQCRTCHVGNETAVYTCTACHEQQEMVEEHADEGITNIVNCIACHADGEKPDDD